MNVLAMETNKNTPSTRKVRRDTRGGKRGPGWKMQREGRRIRRPDARGFAVHETETTLTSVAGLVQFGSYLREQGVDAELGAAFGQMKRGPMVVYPMPAQMRLLLDLHVSGEARVFGIEAMAHDPLFVRLAGGAVPSIDVVYDDLARFEQADNARLENIVARHGLASLAGTRPKIIHIDVDTTVCPMFGEQQDGAVPGPNPRYHGRPSYHPVLARVAETDSICGALLRPGNTSFGNDDVATVVAWVKRARATVGPRCIIRVRIDAAGDCTALLQELQALGVYYYTKARITQDLASAIMMHSPWHTLDCDADRRPTRQGAEIMFQRGEWNTQGITPRVIAIRSRDRINGKQLYLWSDLDYTVQCWLTNDPTSTMSELASIYNDRAGIEPLIAELKNGWYIGKASSAIFEANHAAFLIKLLAHNLMSRFVVARCPALSRWRAPWLRRVLILRPGRLVRSGRRTIVRTTAVMPLRC
jgi:hypothetical protein